MAELTFLTEDIIDYFTNLIRGKRKECSEIIKKMNRKVDFDVKDLYENVFRKSLYEIGRLWELNRISVATEHLATGLTEALMNDLYYQLISEKSVGRKVICTCVEAEDHQVGIKMVADIFEKNGWGTVFLGGSTPLEEMIKFIDEFKPDVLALSLTIYFNMSNLLKTMERITGEFKELPVIIGGQAFRSGGEDKLSEFSNVRVIKNLYELEENFIHKF